MALSDIAAGIEVVEEQRDRGVPSVDGADADLAPRLAARADALPCTPEAAATVVETHTAGTSIEESAREAGIAPVTAAKALHRCGVGGVSPLAPAARSVLRDWLAGDLPRSEAKALTGADEAEFALATYVETHDPIPDLAEAAEGALEPDERPAVAKRDALEDTMSSVTDLGSR